jgi:hypothetical protein
MDMFIKPHEGTVSQILYFCPLTFSEKLATLVTLVTLLTLVTLVTLVTPVTLVTIVTHVTLKWTFFGKMIHCGR